MRHPRRTTPRTALLLALVIAALLPGLGAAQEDGASSYFEVDSVRTPLDSLDDVQLETPQACVEHFVAAARQGLWAEASAALDLRLAGEVDQKRAADLARKFFFVLNQELWIDWGRLPDRPDGVIIGSSLGGEDPMAGQVRRSLELGTISVHDRDVPIQVHRVKAPDADPVWLFSAHTVDNIEELWEAHGPSWLARQMPSWARERGPLRIPVWQWIGLLLALLLAPLAGHLCGKVLCRFLARRLPRDVAELAEDLQTPMAGMTGAFLVWITVETVLGLPSSIAAFIEPLALILLVAMITWFVMRIVSFLFNRVVTRSVYPEDEEASDRQRQLLTKITVIRHVLLLAVILLGVSAVLLHFDSLRTLGFTMLTSAGAMAVILGIAGHAVLGNLIAGLQIALAQPFRIGDTVYVEGNWGQIEEITYVNILVRTWDERRLVFPVGYFVSHWFENWSKNDPYLVKPIFLKVDYRADVERIRERFLELVKEDENWARDRDEPQVLLTESDEETITVRLTCGGPDPDRTWLLVCRVREKLIAWLQQEEDGAFLPRRRHLVANLSGPAVATTDADAEGPRGDRARIGPEQDSDGGDGDGDG